MSLKNENIALMVGVLIVIVGHVLTGGDPSNAEGALMAILGLGTALGISYYLDERDRRRGVPQKSPFRR